MDLQSVYERLPVAMQHAAVTLQGAAYYRTRYGGQFESQLERLTATEFASEAELLDRQNRELRSVLAFAFRYVPHYRELARSLGCEAGDFRTAADLRGFPVTTKQQVRDNPDSFRSSLASHGKLISWHTSGTTGSPLCVVYTREAVQRLYAFVELYRLQAGVSRSHRRGQFTGKLIAQVRGNERSPVFWRYDLASRCILLSTVHLRRANLPFYAAALTRFNPAYLSGYPSSMYVLAQHYLHCGEKAPKLTAALTSAETLLDHQRAVIEEAFETRVFDQYGQTEMQSFWYECSHQRMHAHPLAGITEILDEHGTPSRNEHTGDVVLTGFLNMAMPLIRYQVGDRAAITSRLCPCGRQMQGITRIDGRREDYVYTRERGFVGRLDPAFKGVKGILESQIVQVSIDVVEVRYVAGAGFSASELIRLESNLRDRLGSEVRLGFIAVEAIPRTSNGKFRAVISHVPFLSRGEIHASAGTFTGAL